jgi:hypothetical protein
MTQGPNDESPLGENPLEVVGGANASAPVKVKTRKPSAETTFRILLQEQMDLTALADSKANMMIQVNGLIMSILLASSSIILEARMWLRLPCAALACTALVSIVFAVLAARPKLVKPSALRMEDVDSGRVNLLFFGNFSRLREVDFIDRMRDLFSDDERVYEHLSRHMHGVGRVLLGKFDLLRVSYTAFLIGLFSSGALFVVGLFMEGAS